MFNRMIPMLLCFLLFTSCSSKQIYSDQQWLMGTLVQITVIAASKDQAHQAIQAAFGEIKRIEALLSYFRPDSDVSKINNAHGAVWVHEETFSLIKKCNSLSELSSGAFDISFAGVGQLWTFGRDFMVPPDKEIQVRLRLVNYKNITLNDKNKTVRLEVAGMKIGLGSIGKRYAIGRAVGILQACGIHDGMVQTGGDLQVIGAKFGAPWVIGVKNPRGEGLVCKLPVLSGETVSTSGDYERAQIVNGKRYHHIIDPRTGYPTTTFSSVTVITAVPENADGLSTAIFVGGKQNVNNLLSHFKDTYVILIDLEMNLYVSKELKNRLKPADEKFAGIQWL